MLSPKGRNEEVWKKGPWRGEEQQAWCGKHEATGQPFLSRKVGLVPDFNLASVNPPLSLINPLLPPVPHAKQTGLRLAHAKHDDHSHKLGQHGGVGTTQPNILEQFLNVYLLTYNIFERPRDLLVLTPIGFNNQDWARLKSGALPMSPMLVARAYILGPSCAAFQCA